MKATLSLFVILLVVAGFGIIGNALAQPDPAEPASEAAAADAAPEPAPAPEGDKPAESKPDAPAGTTEPEKKLGVVEQAKGLYSAVKGGEWILGLGFLAMLIGTIGRLAMGRRWDFWKTKAGGYTMAGILGVAALGSGIISAGTFNLDILMAATTVLFSAMASHGVVKGAAKAAKAAVK